MTCFPAIWSRNHAKQLLGLSLPHCAQGRPSGGMLSEGGSALALASLMFTSLLSPQHLAVLAVTVSLALTMPQGLRVSSQMV